MRKSGKILLRGACLVNFTLEELKFPRKWPKESFRAQRADYALKLSESADFHAEPMENHYPFSRLDGPHDFKVRYVGQRKDFFGEENVRLIIMDSSIEAFGAIFTNRETKNGFCSFYGFVDRNEKFRSLYDIGERLTMEETEMYLRRFFQKIVSVYGNVPVVFLCFSAKCDPRVVYKERCEGIEKIAKKLSGEFSNLHVYALDFVEKRGDGDDHPYHYTPETYRRLAERIAADGKEWGVKLVWHPPKWLSALGKFFYTKEREDTGLRRVKLLGGVIKFAYLSRRRFRTQRVRTQIVFGCL